jgi:hypothetical protein
MEQGVDDLIPLCSLLARSLAMLKALLQIDEEQDTALNEHDEAPGHASIPQY